VVIWLVLLMSGGGVPLLSPFYPAALVDRATVACVLSEAIHHRRYDFCNFLLDALTILEALAFQPKAASNQGLWTHTLAIDTLLCRCVNVVFVYVCVL
jgi:hypothetical protein